jgi:hypothetical protein
MFALRIEKMFALDSVARRRRKKRTTHTRFAVPRGCEMGSYLEEKWDGAIKFPLFG